MAWSYLTVATWGMLGAQILTVLFVIGLYLRGVDVLTLVKTGEVQTR